VMPPATTPSFLPVAGLLLLAAAILVMFVRRRHQQGE
jgi:LPXTG-motif cell wall-anchored protein